MRIPAFKHLPGATVLLASALLLGACGKQQVAIVARVGDEVITEEAFRSEAVRRSVWGDDAKRALLEQMVRDLKLFRHAREKGYEKDPEIAREYRAMLIGRAKQDFGVGAETTGSAVSDLEIQAYYDANPSEFAIPSRVRAAMIFVSTSKNLNSEALAERRRKIEDARAAIVAAATPSDAHFGALAVNFSEDQATRYIGGDLGYQVERLASFSDDSAAHAALFALNQPGQLSEIVAGHSGFYVFKLLERNPPSVHAFARVRDRIRSKLQASRRQEKEKAFTTALAAMPSEISSDVLTRIALPPPRLAENRRTSPPAVPGATTQTP